MINQFPEYIKIENRIIHNSESKSKYKDRFGIQYKEKFWKKLNGERREPDGTIVRYVDGYIDGNIYDKEGYIVHRFPAIEYGDDKEYWTRGYPDGFPAILQKSDLDQEYWICGQLIGIFDYRGKAIFQEGYTKEDYYTFVIPDCPLLLCEPTLEEINESLFLSEISKKITTVEQALSYDNEMTFSQLLSVLKHLKNRKCDSSVYKRVHLDKRIYSDIKRGKKSVSFDNGILLAMSFELSFDEMIKFLSLAGQGFKRGKREKIIKKYFDKRNYSVFELNTELYKNKLELITDKEKHEKISPSHQI